MHALDKMALRSARKDVEKLAAKARESEQLGWQLIPEARRERILRRAMNQINVVSYRV